MKTLLNSAFRLGTGEAVSRLASFALYAYISRYYGVELLGVVALAQTISTYVTMGTDQGLRMIGARTVAKYPSAARSLIPEIVRKRLICCAACVLVACLYALWGPVPTLARWYVLGFALAVIPYAFSLDWLAWGLDHLGWLGFWRGAVGVLFVTGAIAGIRLTRSPLPSLTIANAGSAVAGASLMWLLWRFRWQSRCIGAQISPQELQNAVRWAVVLPLGISTMLNLMFNSFDTVMLAAMTSAREVGRYSAAYKILFIVFGAYYLITQSLYPKLSRATREAHLRRMLRMAIGLVIVVGAMTATLISISSGLILHLVYGSDLGSVRVLQLLSIAIPMDFVAALLGTVMVSRGHDKPVLWGALSATAGNIGLNLWLIPRWGATGAAWATLLSYGILLGAYGVSYRIRPLFVERQPTMNAAEMAAS